ncbi:hypothetical protein [Sphingomonas sp. CARO-RG-8B-R24-01]|uniref:hypothetical protein n=1 Tax=Sphingomonas sp. CARO-RG-8B-R24-01 TaxID=2914831 RepID=UPI001F59875A|nr:hypothetical protein [Sphingomonas sp. CARO-RG-8B-R24-01]
MTDRPIIVSLHIVRSDPAARQLHILQHALGVDHYGQGEQHRSHFVTGAGSDDYPDCIALVEAGLMWRKDGATLMFGGDDFFRVTDEGRAFVVANSPPPPKLTRSQRRYQAWLDADCNLSFIDYCRRAGAGALA